MNIVKVESVFNSTTEKVWEAITNPEFMKIWYFDISNFKLEVGNDFTFYGQDEIGYIHKCSIINFEENKLLKHSWTYPEISKGSTTVTWELEKIDDKVKVILTHEGLETFNDAGADFAPENFEMGWNAIVKSNLRNYLYGIKKLVFNVKINAPTDVIWKIMWDKQSYSKWTAPFCEGSYYEGEIKLGNRIHFLAPTFDGMYSDVFYLTPNKVIIFKHIGKLEDLKEQPIDADTERWTGCFESYKYNEVDGVTTLIAEVDCVPEYIDYMNEKFQLALNEVKKISE
jgi:uncharacterized protein YndB with AHSA1/START domain